MRVTPTYLTGRLSNEEQKSLDFFRNLFPEQWEQTVYTQGSCWTIRQVLAHFVTSEKGFGRLIENILADGPGSPEDFDIDAYNERKVDSLSKNSPSDMMRQFSKERQRTVDLVSGLDQDDLTKEGRHPFLGVASLADIIKLIYRHNQIHLREVRKVLS